jgi:hypothetical protein
LRVFGAEVPVMLRHLVDEFQAMNPMAAYAIALASGDRVDQFLDASRRSRPSRSADIPVRQRDDGSGMIPFVSARVDLEGCILVANRDDLLEVDWWIRGDGAHPVRTVIS